MSRLITIVGPTACGKTELAVAVADRWNGEILSADSRQLYCGMDIGTGKDLASYRYGGRTVPFHLIDCFEAGYRCNLFEYQSLFDRAAAEVEKRGRQIVFCGGTGLYVESVLKGYRLPAAPENPELRRSLQHKTLEELTHMLQTYKQLHNTTDTDTCQRAIRAIEIAEYARLHPVEEVERAPRESLTVGVHIDRESRRRRITDRLLQRLEEGLVEEVEQLMRNGVSASDLIYYGLEYRFVTQYLIGERSYDEMVRGLETAIHQFAKRQMTWFRGMERRGIPVRWLDFAMPTVEKLDRIETWLRNS